MVHYDHIGIHRFFTRFQYKAIGITWTLFAQAIVVGRGNRWDYRTIFRNIITITQITSLRG